MFEDETDGERAEFREDEVNRKIGAEGDGTPIQESGHPRVVCVCPENPVDCESCQICWGSRGISAHPVEAPCGLWFDCS